MSLQLLVNENGTEYNITIKNVFTANDRERIEHIIAAFNGMINEYTDYFIYDDPEIPDMETDNAVGTLNLIPEGCYEGMNIQEAYEENGHYALAYIMLKCNKMERISEEKKQMLMEETIQFAIPLIRRQEITFERFLKVYGKFLENKAPGKDKTVYDWLTVPEEEQKIAYNALVDNLTSRMESKIARKAEAV